ncbi:MAG: hypothetical protein ABWY78_04965 [Microvirga sp.]
MPNTGLLVDPHTKTVTRVNLPASPLEWRPLVGAATLDHATLRPASIDGIGVAVVVDDNGMFREDQLFWAFAPFPDRVFAGRGLLYEFDIEGETAPGTHLMSPEQLSHHILWRDHIEVAGEEVTTDEVEDPILGRMTRISSHIKFRPKP